MKSGTLSIYLSLIPKIDQSLSHHPTRLINRVVLLVFKTMAYLLRKLKRIEFPQRSIGGTWWISRYQIEFCMGWLEPESIAWVKKLIKPDMTVIDIGAHLGYYTDLFSRLAGAYGKVYALEVSPENFPLLVKNLKSRNRFNVTTYQYPASDRSGVVNLHVSPGHSNHSLVAGYTPSEKTIAVEAVRLDDLLPTQSINFIKIDVEGHEPHVLKGMQGLIQRSRNVVLLVEYNPVALSKEYASPQVLLNLLVELGLEYQAILDDGSLGKLPEGNETINLLCTKSK